MADFTKFKPPGQSSPLNVKDPNAVSNVSYSNGTLSKTMRDGTSSTITSADTTSGGTSGSDSLITSGAVYSGLTVVKEYIESYVQQSVFEISVEDNEYVLYWHGTAGECPYTLTLENGEYVLNYTYETS